MLVTESGAKNLARMAHRPDALPDVQGWFTTASPFHSIRRVRPDGTEFWSARDLMPLMGYSRWENFRTPISRAMKTAENQGLNVDDQFLRSRKLTGQRHQGGGNSALDYQLSRYAAYLVAMNGDPNIAEVAAAQYYFAVKTREAERSKAPLPPSAKPPPPAIAPTPNRTAGINGNTMFAPCFPWNSVTPRETIRPWLAAAAHRPYGHCSIDGCSSLRPAHSRHGEGVRQLPVTEKC